jgi:alanine dehydrogenase
MPGAVPRTATFALTNFTISYALKIANQGFEAAVATDPALAKGINIYRSHVTHETVPQDLNYDYKPLEQILKG